MVGTSAGRKITLIGAGGVPPIPLLTPQSRRSGPKLTEVPSGLTGWSAQHMWAEARGVPGGVWKGLERAVRQIRLPIIIKGPDVVEQLDKLLMALGEQGEQVTLQFDSVEHGRRFLDVRVESVSDPEWHGVPGRVGMVNIEVIVTAGRPFFRSAVQRATFTAAQVASGAVVVPVSGTRPIWPVVMVEGSYSTFKLRLDKKAGWQDLPPRKEGWYLRTDPARRAIESLSPRGIAEFAGLVPFWAEPAPVKLTSPGKGEATLYTQLTGAGADFKMTVEYTPEANRAW